MTEEVLGFQAGVKCLAPSPAVPWPSRVDAYAMKRPVQARRERVVDRNSCCDCFGDGERALSEFGGEGREMCHDGSLAIAGRRSGLSC